MVRTTADRDVRVLTLARPERRNALDRESLRELDSAVADASEPVLYLHGEGPAFCAGADLDAVRELDAESALRTLKERLGDDADQATGDGRERAAFAELVATAAFDSS